MRDRDSFDWRSKDGNYKGGSGTNSSGSGGEGISMENGRDLYGKTRRFSSGRLGGQQEKTQVGNGEMTPGNDFAVANPNL